MLLVFGAPCQLALLAGREHGRTIPLADSSGISQRACCDSIFIPADYSDNLVGAKDRGCCAHRNRLESA